MRLTFDPEDLAAKLVCSMAELMAHQAQTPGLEDGRANFWEGPRFELAVEVDGAPGLGRGGGGSMPSLAANEDFQREMATAQARAIAESSPIPAARLARSPGL